MEYFIIAITVIFGAGLTFFSGFGLGTLMLPIFSIFFPVPIAIGATAIVHLANNIFKFILVSRHIHLMTLLRFGIPALLFAAIGGYLLNFFSDISPIMMYTLSSARFEITTVKIVIGGLMLFFAWFELDPRFDNLKIKAKHIPFGGALSGFFGGISGHQGAFRAAFLAKANLTKEQFIGTSNAVSLIVDLARLYMYFFAVGVVASNTNSDLMIAISDGKMLLIVAVVFAFLGTFLGKQLVKKTTIRGIQRVVGILLFAMGTLMMTGIL